MTKVLNLVFGPVMKLKLNQTLFGTACLVSMLIAMAAPAAAQTNSADVSLDIAVPMSALSRVSTPNTKTVTPKQTPRSVFLEGRAYHDGEGRPQDFVKAQTLYRKAAAMGSNGARINLGYMAFTGEGVAQNFAEASYWYGIAAKTGDKDARQNLIMMDQRGLGLEAFTPPTPLSPQIAEDQSVIDVIDVETPLIPASPEDLQPIEEIETPVLKAAPLALRSTSKVVAVSPVMPSVTQPVHMEPTQTEQNDTHINQTEVEAETIEVSDPVYLNAEAKQTENKSPFQKKKPKLYRLSL